MGRAEEAPNRPVRSGEGLRQYYLSHIHDLLLQLRVKTHNLHRLEAQRNDLNSKGKLISHLDHLGFAHPIAHRGCFYVASADVERGASAAARAGVICWRSRQGDGQNEGSREGTYYRALNLHY